MIWKKIDFWDILDIYSVSEYGDIRNDKRNKIRKSHLDKYGYLNIILYDKNHKKKNFKIHRIVARAFIENLDHTRMQVNHIDGIKNNNHYTNLEWCNCSENQIHAVIHNLHGNLKINLNDVEILCKLIAEGNTTIQILDKLNITERSKRKEYVKRIHIIKHRNAFNYIYKKYLSESSTTIESKDKYYIIDVNLPVE